MRRDSNDTIRVRAIDSLIKVFDDLDIPMGPTGVPDIFTAKNEYEPIQLAIRSREKLTGLHVSKISAIHSETGEPLPTEGFKWNFVGFIPVEKNTQKTPLSELVRVAPCNIPDPFLKEGAIDLPANKTIPLWVTIYVPSEASPGRYRGLIEITCEESSKAIPFELYVYPFELPDTGSLKVTNWFYPGYLSKYHNVEIGTDGFWTVLAEYARNMKEHRQNVFTVLWSLIQISLKEDGSLAFDFSIFDKYIQTFLDAGVNGGIEIWHVAHYKGGWKTGEIEFVEVKASSFSGEEVLLEPEAALSVLLPALQDHLEAKGWLDLAMMHVCDEPSMHHLDSWYKVSDFVHRVAPKIKRIDAIETLGFKGRLEVWVPKLNHLKNWFESYKAAQRDGAELWYYVCNHPTGNWLNRCLDFPLMKIRLFHWLNYLYDITGYLHWGWNHWKFEPFGPPAPAHLPPGESHVIYPGEGGPLDSLRWETQRDSIEDYEYLVALERKTEEIKAKLGNKDFPAKQRGKEFCHRLIRGFNEFSLDIGLLRETLRELSSEIEDLEESPLLLWATDPMTETDIVPDPNWIIVRGITEKGTVISINGQSVSVSPDGSFIHQLQLDYSGIISVEATLNGKKKFQQRRYNIVKF